MQNKSIRFLLITLIFFSSFRLSAAKNIYVTASAVCTGYLLGNLILKCVKNPGCFFSDGNERYQKNSIYIDREPSEAFKPAYDTKSLEPFFYHVVQEQSRKKVEEHKKEKSKSDQDNVGVASLLSDNEMLDLVDSVEGKPAIVHVISQNEHQYKIDAVHAEIIKQKDQKIAELEARLALSLSTPRFSAEVGSACSVGASDEVVSAPTSVISAFMPPPPPPPLLNNKKSALSLDEHVEIIKKKLGITTNTTILPVEKHGDEASAAFALIGSLVNECKLITPVKQKNPVIVALFRSLLNITSETVFTKKKWDEEVVWTAKRYGEKLDENDWKKAAADFVYIIFESLSEKQRIETGAKIAIKQAQKPVEKSALSTVKSMMNKTIDQEDLKKAIRLRKSLSDEDFRARELLREKEKKEEKRKNAETSTVVLRNAVGRVLKTSCEVIDEKDEN